MFGVVVRHNPFFGVIKEERAIKAVKAVKAVKTKKGEKGFPFSPFAF